MDRPVLAEGEVTGHCHLLDGSVEVWEVDDRLREFTLTEPTPLTHQEHQTITLPARDLVSGRALEYDHFAEEARAVRD
jgi:hypothetical protein